MAITWAILTGEYPPQPGGVADYTRQIAHGLAKRGDTVHVFAPPLTTASINQPPLTNPFAIYEHRLPDCFETAGRADVEKAIRRMSEPRRLLVQYVPHAFGKRAMNIGFARWVRQIARREKLDVMFHEVAFPMQWRQRFRHQFLGWVTRRMAWRVGANAERLFISTASWQPVLRKLGLRQTPQLAPIPSNFAPPRIVRDRSRGPIAGPGRTLVGHFGTYATLIEPTIRNTIIELATAKAGWRFVLMGRGSENCLNRIQTDHPQLTARMRATGTLEPDALVQELTACDLVVQPFPDGVTTRRTSVMASLCLGVPIVTNSGLLTESFWRTCGAVAMTTDNDPHQLAERACQLGDDETELCRMGLQAATLYREKFELSKTIDSLRSPAVFG